MDIPEEALQWKCPRPRPWEPRGTDFVRACAVEIHMDTRTIFYERIKWKNGARQDRDNPVTCAVEMHMDMDMSQSHFMREKYRASGNAHGHVTRAIFPKINNKMPRQSRVGDFARASTVEMHIDKKNAGDQSTYPDLTLALTPTVTPQCGHTVRGNIEKVCRRTCLFLLPIFPGHLASSCLVHDRVPIFWEGAAWARPVISNYEVHHALMRFIALHVKPVSTSVFV